MVRSPVGLWPDSPQKLPGRSFSGYPHHMPFKSEAQRRKFYAMAESGKISKKTVQEWEDATPKDVKLPERVTKKAFDLGAQAALEHFKLAQGPIGGTASGTSRVGASIAKPAPIKAIGSTSTKIPTPKLPEINAAKPPPSPKVQTVAPTQPTPPTPAAAQIQGSSLAMRDMVDRSKSFPRV